jgi:hypothetical protein
MGAAGRSAVLASFGIERFTAALAALLAADAPPRQVPAVEVST